MTFVPTAQTEIVSRTALGTPARRALAGIALLVGLLGLALSGGRDGLGAQTCRVEPAQPRLGVETDATMRMARGLGCPILMQTAGSAIEDLSIVQAPSNGSLRLRGRTGVIYLPAARFTGEDSFVFGIKAHDGAVAKTAIVRVRVSVE